MKDLFDCCFPKKKSIKEENQVHTDQLDPLTSPRSEEKLVDYNNDMKIRLSPEKGRQETEEQDRDLIMNLASTGSSQKNSDQYPKSTKPNINIEIIQPNTHNAINNNEIDNEIKYVQQPNSIFHFGKDGDESSSNYLITQTIDSDTLKAIPDLLMEETEGELLNGHKLIINANGIDKSKRHVKKGFVFFGSSLQNNNKELINDIQLKTVLNVNEGYQEHLFVIYYSKEKSQYFIRPYHNHLMSFLLIKLNGLYKVHNNENVLIADLFFKLNVNRDNILTITKLSSKRSNEEIEYKYKCDYGIITIGRDKNCTISFPTNRMFSKVHTTFYYDQVEDNWFICDGNDKPSMNGTWMMPRHSYAITDGCIFKIPGNSKFKITFLYK